MNMEKSQARPYNILVVAVSAAEITFNTFDGFLTYCGYKATVCRGYAEATEILWNNYQAFNLTVVGINKPAKDTFDFIRKVKLVFSLPVIVVSTDCSQKSMFMAAESGCCAYFDPVKFGRVAKEFRNHLVSDNLKFNPLPPRHYAGAGTSDSGGEVVVLDDDCPSSSTSQQTKKRRVVWTDELHADFYEAVQFLGVSNAVPKKILLFMQRKHPHLSRENIASHLQKYREQRKPPYFSRKNDPSYLQNRERMNNMLKKKMQSGVEIETMVLRRNHFPNPSPLQIRNENENQNGYYPLPNPSPPQIENENEKEKEKGNQNGDYQQPNFAHEQFHLSFSQISFVQFPDPHLQVQHVQHDGNLGSNSRENEIAKKMNTKIYSGSLSV